jgi:hypothetical protein
MSYLKRILIFLFAWCALWYLGYLFFQWVVISDWPQYQNYICYILLVLVFLYYIIFYSLKPTYIKRNKVINTLIWVFLIYLSHYYLLNSGYDNIYYWDIFSVIWVILTIIWPTNLLISKEVQKIKEDNYSEIIEIE